MRELTLKQNLLWNTVGCLIYQGCQWLTTILVVILSPSYENSGIMAFAMATANIYTGLATYNTRTFQVSDIRNQFSSQNYVGFRLITVTAAFIVCGTYSLFVSQSSAVLIAMLAFLLFKADESFVNVLYGVDQKANRMDYIGVSQGVRGVLTVIVFSTLLFFTKDLFAAFLGMAAVGFVITLMYDLPRSSRLSSVVPTLTIERGLGLFKSCAPAVLALFFYGAVATVSRQWFGVAYGEEALGIYAAVATPCVLVQVMANYLYNPFLVSLAKSWSSGEVAVLGRQLKKLLFAMMLVILGVVVLAFLFGPFLLEVLYGQSIEEYAWMIVPAVLAASVMAVAFFVTDLLIVVRSFKGAVLVNAAALAVCLVLINPLIEAWYMNGINVAIIVSFLVGIFIGALFVIGILKSGRSRTKA